MRPDEIEVLIRALVSLLEEDHRRVQRLREAIEAHKAAHTDPTGAAEGCCKPADDELWRAADVGGQ